MRSSFRLLLHLCLGLSAGSCVPTSPAAHRSGSSAAAGLLKDAAVKTTADEQRAALYLQAAAEAHSVLSKTSSDEAARRIYNQAATDLVVLLRSSRDASLWNRPLSLSAGGNSYHLRFAAGDGRAIWDPGYFTDFVPASGVKHKIIDRLNHQPGYGGALVGVRKMRPLEPFSPKVGITAAVSAVLDFRGRNVTLALIDPSEMPEAFVGGKMRPLEADFSAPLAYYPAASEMWNGLMGAISVQRYMGSSGLYMLQPYDSRRIPLIFVHGLISTPQMWRNVVNEMEMDPDLRGRYQCMVFGYPTGNPPAYSALKLREELGKFHQMHPDARRYVLVGHSMGGLVSRMQATTLDRGCWDVIGKDKASKVFSRMQKKNMIRDCLIFDANPRIGRMVFICTPHRGSEVAIGSLGELGRRLISLPLDFTSAVTSTMGDTLIFATGKAGRLPNRVTGLSPANPTLKVLDSRPMKIPYHTILGDRGKGDSPESSDGVVKYWSSHLAGAKSEKIVPGPHGACEMPETLDELRRILRLHLEADRRKATARGAKPTYW